MNLVNPGVPDGSITTSKLADRAVTAVKVEADLYPQRLDTQSVIGATTSRTLTATYAPSSKSLVQADVVYIINNASGNALTIKAQSQTEYGGKNRSEDDETISNNILGTYTMRSKAFVLPCDAAYKPRINVAVTGFGTGDSFDAFVSFYELKSAAYT